MMWDQDGNTNVGALIFEDSVIQIAGANVTYTQGISTDELVFTGTDHANCGITFGSTGTNGLDLTLQSITSGDHIVFDAGTKTLTSTDCVIVALTSSTGAGLAIPYGATASPSGDLNDGSIYYEVDAHKLWVHEGGGTWKGVVLS
jgi:hypothetical protein